MSITATATHANLPSPSELTGHLAHLEEFGYTIIPDFLDRGTTARLREHMDSLLPSIQLADLPEAKRVNDLRHPFPGALMSEMVTDEHLELGRKLVRATDLRLTEQVLIRTDLSPHRGAHGWHIDYAFYPRHRAAVPRQTYVQMVHALSTVVSGGGATMLVPGSHRAHYAASAQVVANGEGERFRDQAAFKAEILRLAAVDTAQAIEVLPREGDLVLFDPMCLHSGSHNVTTSPRYVMFMSFFDRTATELNDSLNRQHYRDGFPEWLRQGLAPERRSLLDR